RRNERDPNPARLRDLTAPGPRCVDDDGRTDEAIARFDAGDLAGLNENPRDRGAWQQFRPMRSGAARASHRDLCRIEVHVVADAHDCRDSLSLEERVQAVRLLRRYALDVESHAPTTFDIGVNHFRILFTPRNLEAPGRYPVERLPGILDEVLDPLGGELDQPDHEVAFAHA